MKCLAAAELARAVTTGDVPSHVDDCLVCRRTLDQQRAMRAALQALPEPRLEPARWRAIKAETLASAGQGTARSQRWRWSLAAVAVAAVAWLVVGVRPDSAFDASPGAATESIAIAEREVLHEAAPPPPRAPAIAAGEGTVLRNTPGEQRDTIVLADGSVDVDTRGTRDADVRIGRTIVRVDDARVRIRAHQHAVISVEVVVGAAHVTGPDQQITLEHDTIWHAEPPPASLALAAFRDAWVALRAGRDREAIALFDRATDPMVAEEASYWAAVATLRAGDLVDAKQRFSDFLARWPSSQYASKARAALRAH